MDFSRQGTLLVAALLLGSAATPTTVAANECEAWPGEHRPLPTTTDSDPFLARWAELRAEELRAMADRWEAERPAAAATLRAHAACLAPRTAESSRAPTIRTTRVGRPFPSRPTTAPDAPTYQRPAAAASITEAPAPPTAPASIAEASAPTAAPPAIVEPRDPSAPTAGVGSGEARETAAAGLAPSGPASGAVRILGERTDSPVERGQERPAEASAPLAGEAVPVVQAAPATPPADRPAVSSLAESAALSPDATSRPPEPSVTPAPSEPAIAAVEDDAAADSPGVLLPKRPDPRVGRDKPFPPPPRDEPTSSVVIAPTPNVEPSSEASRDTPPSLSSGETRPLPDVAASVSSATGSDGSSAEPAPSASASAEEPVTRGRIVALDSEAPEGAAEEPRTPSSDAREAMREAILAAGARARAEQLRIRREREAAAQRAAARAPNPEPPEVSETAEPASTTAPVVGPPAPPPVAATPETPEPSASASAAVARTDPSPATPAVAMEETATPSAVSSPPALSGSSGLDRVRAEVRQARFEAALEIATELRGNLEDEVSAPVLAELEVLAATAALALGREDQAQTYFASALKAAPDLTLDPQNHSPKVLKLFERVRTTTVTP